MIVLRHLESPPAAATGVAVALGNFDGVHRGHKVVIQTAVQAARDLGAPSAVLTFEPHPRDLFFPGADPYRITPFRSKAARFQDLGVDVMIAMPFTWAFSQVTAEQFVAKYLVGGLQARHVVTGYDFAFGHKRLGGQAFLEAKAEEHGFGLTVVAPVGVEDSDYVFGSSHVRRHLRAGSPVQAAEHLGAWWEIMGRVRPGASRGHDLGYPTANLDLGNVLRPKFGIYAVRVRLEGEDQWRPGVANLGIRPMFESTVPLLEVHLFDFDRALYGRQMCVALVEYLRPEAKFESSEALSEAMDGDSANARRILADPAYAQDRFTA